MNKLPAKQIYLLSIIIIGIIALSVYSTYALFTFESVTSDVVSIHTPKSLTISENIYEYQQLTIEPNTVTTTDIDIYNSFEYDVCYSIWYKVVGENIDENKIQIFEKSDNILTSSSILTINNNIRVTITIINDNDEPAKINIGTIGARQENNSCSLNLDTDKKLITSSHQFDKTLVEQLLDEIDNTKEEKSNYITYKDQTDTITYKETDKIYISETFTYENEIFTLDEPIEVTIQQLVSEEYLGNNLEEKTIYFCKQDSKCSILYKITELKEQVPINQTDEEENENKEKYYNIEKYDKLIGYMEGTSGLRKIDDNDYVFYGDNPNNYIYYNCKNNDISTCELWRIIGLFYNEETKKYNIKIIKNTSIGKYQFDELEEKENLIWTNSTLYKYLNEEYKFINNYNNYIIEHLPNNEILSSLDNEIVTTTLDKPPVLKEDTESKVNILSIKDYINTSSCKKDKISEYNEECLTNNWLNNIEISNEWTLTLKEPVEIPIETEVNETTENITENIQENNPEDNNETTTENTENNTEETTEPVQPIETILLNYGYGIGNSIIETNVNEQLEVRPVVYLKSRMLLINGNGTFENPYIIK